MTSSTVHPISGPQCVVRHEKPIVLDGQLVISGDWHQCLVVQELMACCARTYDFDEFGIRKAVTAALANALNHGNGGAPEKRIRVEYAIDESEFRVTITDEGSGFDHEALVARRPNCASEVGRGVGLMRHYMTAVHFSGPGNRVELSKRRAGCECSNVGHD